MSQRDPSSDSSYPPFKTPPKLESQIPHHLLAEATPFERHVIEELSVMKQMDTWTVDTLGSTYRYVVATNGKANRALEGVERANAEIAQLKQDKAVAIGGWKGIVGFCGIVAGVIGFVLTVYGAMMHR